jgi:protein TonB
MMEPIEKVCPTLDAGVIAIVNQALRRSPAERYQDLARMRNDLAATRLRLELEEERAATAATAQAGETAVVSTPVPSAVSADDTVQVVRPATPIPSPALVDAERAMAMGNYRAALTLAGRSAAEGVARHDASSIVQRAHAALLEQGRRLEQHTPTIALATPAPTPKTAISGPMGNWIAIGVAVVALVAAGAAVLFRPAPATPAPASAPQQSAAPLPSPPGDTTKKPVEPGGPPVVTPPREESRAPVPAPTPAPATPGRSESPRASLPPAGPPPRPPVMPARVGVNGVTAPVRTRVVEPVYPPAALAAGVQGTVELDITISTEGDVADARVTRSIPMLDQAAVQAVEKWKYAPTLIAGSPVAVNHRVQVAFKPPVAEPAPREREATSPVAPPTSPPAEPPPPRLPAPSPPAPAEPAPPAAPDPRAEEAAIRTQLRNYEAAWKALDLAALQQLQRFSSQEVAAVQRTIAGAESYDVTVTVDRVRLNGTRAEVTARVARRFQPKSGRATSTDTPSTFELEKQGDRWMIVRIR